MIRKKLQAGTGRKTIGALAGIAAAFSIGYYWDRLLIYNINPLDAGQKVAFVAAAFSVTAYNLRTRVIDLISKFEGDVPRTNELCAIARNCGGKLTNLVMLFTASAFLLGAGGFIPTAHKYAVWYSTLSTAWFSVSLIQFVYILFAFERLERFVLDDISAKAVDREAKRLLGS